MPRHRQRPPSPRGLRVYHLRRLLVFGSAALLVVASSPEIDEEAPHLDVGDLLEVV